jgi:membrane-associated phospholipid phosphatase
VIFGRSVFDHLKRVGAWMLTGFVVLACYGVGKLAGPPTQLPLTTFDLAIPLLPWTIWVYGSGSKAALLCWLMVPDGRAARRLFVTLALVSVVCCVCFVLWPTTYPRELYPLPAGDSATLREFADLREADSPTNCFPSLHVALAWGMAFNWAAFLRRGRALPFVWAAAVSVGTLTTKQHYLVDVPAGAAVGFGAYALVHWLAAARPTTRLSLADTRAVDALLARVRAHQWRLADLPPMPARPLPPGMGRLLNEVIYVEEIARLNFELLRDASDTPALRELYQLFADEERRHADGLRAILAGAGEPIRPPGLGNALVLDQFDTLRPDRDAALVAVSTPVFETFLDAGTIPFLQRHPALASPAFDAFVERVCTDEAAHIALNWIVTRDVARARGGLGSIGLLLNPNIFRGMAAVPWMSLEVYSLAHSLGYDFATLLPPFNRLWRLHQRYPELARFSLWWPYRLFVVAGALSTWSCLLLLRLRLLFIGWWVFVVKVMGVIARFLFGDALLVRRGLPLPGPVGDASATGSTG